MEKEINFEELEVLRKKCKKMIWGGWIGTILIIFITIFVIGNTGMYPLFVISIILVIFLLSITTQQGKKYNEAVKPIIIQNCFAKTFPDIQYDLLGFSQDEVESMYTIPMGNRFSSEDKISFTYNGYHVTQADVHTEEERSSGKSTTIVTVFEGQILKIQREKSIEGFLIVYEEGGFLRHGKPNSFWNECKKTSRVQTESVDFNKKWTVYASDGEEAFYILTPQMMQLINDFNDKVPGDLTFSFEGNEMRVAIDNGVDSLNVNYSKPLNQETLQWYDQEATHLKEILDALKVDQG